MVVRAEVFLSFFTATLFGQTISGLIVRSAEKGSLHALNKTHCNQGLQIFSFSQMIPRVIHPLFHFDQNFVIHLLPLDFLDGYY